MTKSFFEGLSERQQWQFERYFELLVEWNEKINLTAITEHEDVYLKHFYDSLTLSFNYSLSDQSLCDVGAGAGFPSLPNKILHPDLKITIIDSLNKRLKFLRLLCDELGLENVELVHARAEDAGQNAALREKFDVVTARAVARMNVLSELCLPLVKVGGDFVALKGSAGVEELSEAKVAIKTLGGKIEKVIDFELPDPREIIIVNKKEKTPKKYPRKAGTPNKEPLGGGKSKGALSLK
ncbi:MAG: 16S rRNA (guanine(527)-N(7))-methyltransferase RsmG [Lactobacillales bacterium]|jgi:16S rRNA (guanine527-N7)-methyltransferase|nr:16S rRNA (guanine(527)-N(7))-methyltransferase RsmG [Lactobacillales bacterium]